MTTTPATLLHSGYLRRVDAAFGELVMRLYPDSSNEVALAAALAARAVADGHSALQLDRARTWLAGLDAGSQVSALPDAGAWADALRTSRAVTIAAEAPPSIATPLVLDPQDRLYLRRYFEYERQLARLLVLRASSDSAGSPIAGPASQSDDLDPQQQRALAVAIDHRLTLVTGGPGTGKTSTVLRIIAMLVRRAHRAGGTLRIALAAPTGKAAARLRESMHAQAAGLGLPPEVAAMIPGQATTLHRLLGTSPYQPRPKHHRGAPLPHDVVVVDEVSMVDLPLMAGLVDAVRDDARLILLGDPNQLAAVEAGDVLGALTEAAQVPPLDACHAALRHNYRFDTATGLGTLAGAIVAGDVDVALAALGADASARLQTGSDTSRVIDEACDDLRPLLEARDAAEALQAARRCRVLTALRHGPSGCIAIDAAIEQRLKRTTGFALDAPWWPGRLVMITVNRPDLGLFNGDVGVIRAGTGDGPLAWFEGADGVPRSLPVAALPPHEGAFALTVHKAQGSEFDRVSLVTGPDSAVLTRELLYTGVTRARSAVTLCSTPGTLRTGIERRTLRFSGLADRLREAARATGT